MPQLVTCGSTTGTMAASPPNSPGDRRIGPKGPFGHLLRDAMEPRNGRGRLSYADAVERINRIAKLRDGKRAGYSTATIRNWIGRWVIPSHLTLGWIAEALEVPLQDVIDAADAAENERYKVRYGQSGDTTAAETPADSHPAASTSPTSQANQPAVTPSTAPVAQPLLTAAQLEAEMKRRTFAQYLALAGGFVVFRPDIIAAVLDGTSQVDEALADRLHMRSLQYMQQWDALPPHLLLSAVVAHLDEVQIALKCAKPDQLSHRLHVIAAETAAFAGMLGWFLQNRGLAEINLSIADDYSRITGHRPVQAIVLAIRADFHSHVQLGRNVGSPIARTMLDAAISAAGTSPSPLRAWLLLRQAEEHAVIGEQRQTYTLLESAETALMGVRTMPDGMFKHWNSDMYRAFRGNCEQLLGEYNQSILTLVPVLERIKPDSVSNRIALQADIAAVHARQGDPEQSSRLLGQALATAAKAGLRERVRRVAGIRLNLLTSFESHPTVRNLDEQIRAAIAAPHESPS